MTALVIGNAAHEGSSELKHPGDNADDVTAKLKACGFDAVKIIDCSNAGLDRGALLSVRGLIPPA